ncbi:hypothetical protein BN2364_2954 [Alloalcanivorax xenomutans]|nr:hypothetical protein BN2364_2954 [Alloalcanivorax xenomutans]
MYLSEQLPERAAIQPDLQHMAMQLKMMGQQRDGLDGETLERP